MTVQWPRRTFVVTDEEEALKISLVKMRRTMSILDQFLAVGSDSRDPTEGI